MEETSTDSTKEVAGEYTQEVNVDETSEDIKVEDSTESKPEVEEKEATPEERLEQLQHFRINGSISIKINLTDFKFIRNTFKDKIEWQGPNEAYLLNILAMGLGNILSQFDTKKPSEEIDTQISNSTIEIMNRLQHKIGGKSIDSALKHMKIFGLVSNCAAQLKGVDEEITKLKAELGITDDTEESEKNS